MRGVPFVNRRYEKGVTLLSKMIYKRVRVAPWGGDSPYKTLGSLSNNDSNGYENVTFTLKSEFALPQILSR